MFMSRLSTSHLCGSLPPLPFAAALLFAAGFEDA